MLRHVAIGMTLALGTMACFAPEASAGPRGDGYRGPLAHPGYRHVAAPADRVQRGARAHAYGWGNAGYAAGGAVGYRAAAWGYGAPAGYGRPVGYGRGVRAAGAVAAPYGYGAAGYGAGAQGCGCGGAGYGYSAGPAYGGAAYGYAPGYGAAAYGYAAPAYGYAAPAYGYAGAPAYGYDAPPGYGYAATNLEGLPTIPEISRPVPVYGYYGGFRAW